MIIVSFIFYNNLPESIHEKNRNFIINKINLINDLTKNNVYTFLSNLELILKEKKSLNIFFHLIIHLKIEQRPIRRTF